MKETGNISNKPIHDDVSHIKEVEYSYAYQSVLPRKDMKETGNITAKPVYIKIPQIDQQ